MAAKDLVARTGKSLTERVRVTRGLAAPRPSMGGALTPNETGWLIGVGRAEQQLRPRLLRQVDWVGVVLGQVCMQAGIHLWHSAAWIPAALVPLVGFMYGARRYIRRSLRKQIETATAGELGTLTPGTRVRLRGTIVAQPTVPTLFRGTPAVLFRSRIGAADETRGLDFVLEVNGRSVRVSVRGALLLDEPTRTQEPPACGPVYCDPWADAKLPAQSARLCSALFTKPSPFLAILPSRRYESSVGPGDEVEVIGVLHQEVDPDARDPFSRQVGVTPVLRGGQLPLVVRRVTD